MKILFATTNPAKIKKYGQKLKEKGIEVVTVKDLKQKIDVEENGKDAIENAYIKAKAYYDLTKLPTIGMDNTLYFEGIQEEKQPGTYVRRVNGKTLTDEEMIKYYSNLAKENGGKILAKWIYGMVIYNGKEKYSYTWTKDNFNIIDKPSSKRNIGYPLDSISINLETNKYFVDLTQKEREKNNRNKETEKVIDFILKNI